SMLGIGIVPV
nr:Chain C, SER-MET-LEU-GLY-ILE-GLY-ILE-VAL-PRO-VAL [synthetic construct]